MLSWGWALLRGDCTGAGHYAGGSSNAIICSSILWATHFCRERNSILLPKGWMSGLTPGELEEGENGGIVYFLYRF